MKEFPVDTATACQLKWTWSTIMLNRSTTSSCHRVRQDTLTPENFLNFHNTPKKLNDRQLMLEGKRPAGGCEYCYKIEDAGGYSDRQHHASFEDLTPPELLLDNTATTVTPRILEVYFSNVCNLSCLYCGPWFSSVWENEIKKHGDFGRSIDMGYANWKQNSNYSEMVEKLWQWMRENSQHLRRFHILGGEPFHQKEFVDCLNHFDQYPNPECEFVIITNLMVDDKRMDYYIERIENLVSNNKLAGLQITASLDCWGPQAEYIRTGLNLEQWQRNFEKLLLVPNLRLQINHTVSNLSIPYMPELLEKVNEWSKVKKVYLCFMTVVTPSFMNPDIFDGKIYEDAFEKIFKLMPNDLPFDRSMINYLDGMRKQINSAQVNAQEIQKLKKFLTIIDKRRSTNYPELFPWLDDIFEKNKLTNTSSISIVRI